MFNKRWKKILIWSLSIIVVLGVAGLFAANYAVDKLMNSMAGGFDLESEENTDGSQSVDSTTTAFPDNSDLEIATATVAPLATPTKDVGSKETSPDQEKEETVKDQSTSSPTSSQPTNAPATDKPTVTDGYTAQVSTDKAQDIKKNVTVKEKADVATIVMGQLSVSDIKRLQELASGGLTLDEKREARSIILGKVSEAQYNELSQIAKKYGVSQGKTRDQILVEEQQLQAQEEGSE